MVSRRAAGHRPTSLCICAGLLAAFLPVAMARPEAEPKAAVNTAEQNALRQLQRLKAKVELDPRGHATAVALNDKSRREIDLKPLAALAGLRSLNLYDSEIADADLAHLAGLANLESLNLGFCREITDAGLRNLAALRGLKQLNLGYCKGVTNAGLKSLERLTDMDTLNLSSTSVSDEGLTALHRLERLKALDLDNTQLTHAGLKPSRHSRGSNRYGSPECRSARQAFPISGP